MTVDKHALRVKYRQERDKRLRPDGNDQYVPLTGRFASYADDPYTPATSRAPKTDHVTVVFIGGGFAGLLTGARLKEAGISDVRIVEKGGDYGLYDNALLHTAVTGLSWDDEQDVWIVTTDRGDRFTARFAAMGVGPLHVPKLPGIPGIDLFRGHAFHTSRWDYAYTGDDPSGAPMDRLAGRRVAIIGTGATAVQCVPHLARACERLYVFQRTPSSVDVRANRPTDPEWFAAIATPGWQRRWLENFTAVQTGGGADVDDLVMDGWTDIARRVRARIAVLPEGERTLDRMLEVYEDSDFEKMEEIRARVDAIVADAETAGKLKAWYRQLCKRPCFHDEYLQSFNLPGVRLVDTGGKGVERITGTGVVAAGREYPVDCVIYASGFEVGTGFTRRAGYEVRGRGGVRLSEYWADGMRTLHGTHVHGFPNAFIVQPGQGANLLSNIPHNLTESGQTIAGGRVHAGGGAQTGRGRLDGAPAVGAGLTAGRAGLHAGLLQRRGPGPGT
ncbi:monooxygenase [Nonomuraea typhae]|uniref:Monooxygenase n=1 Tax=Nonomuraea typhae TaxID=2603600 RepID=A0ABW7ZBM6_9ACTN